VKAGRSFMSFDVEHPSGLCRLHDTDVPEAAVALEEAFVERIHTQAGLHVKNIRRGRWWTGEAHDQDVVAATAS
jgi:L,D-peptidoglycan transpeptidase YkuD (ErfK/YbiS/YcfS/YnhG family)